MKYFFHPPRQAGAATAEQIAQARVASKRVFDRIGYRHIYERVEEIGTLKMPGKSVHESARAVPFELAVNKISQNNAYN